MDDFFDELLRGPSHRPPHPDFMKLADIVLRHDGPTSDPTTMHTYSLPERVNQEIDFGSLVYMLKGRLTIYLDMVKEQTGEEAPRPLAIMSGSLWLDAFLLGIEWQKAKEKT